MKAAQVTRFGEPDVLRINDVDRPRPGADEVLVSVEATSVNGHDVLVRAGKVKIVSGRRFPMGVGLDFAGIVAEVGPDVQGYRAGDRVWGTVHPASGMSAARRPNMSWFRRIASPARRQTCPHPRRPPWSSRAPPR